MFISLAEFRIAEIKIMKRFIISILSLSLIIQLLIPMYANAKSDYDDTIKTTPNLYLPRIRDNGRDCINSEDRFGDISDNYMAFFERAVNRTRPQYRDEMIKRYREFRTVIDTEDLGYWAIAQKENDIIFMSSRKSQFKDASVSNSTHFRNNPNIPFNVIRLSDHFGCNFRPVLYTYGDNLSQDHYFNIFKDYKFFINNFPIIYPEGYEGIRIDNLSFKRKQDITPSISYNVSGFKLEAFLCSKQFQDLCKPMTYPWGRDTKFKYEIKNNPTDDKPIYSSGDLSLADSLHFIYNFDKKGKYYLILQYVWPGIPYPDHEDKYNFHVLNLPILIDGSSYFSGTKSQNCENGSCKDYSPFKDCSTLNIIQAIGCHLDNFGIALKSYLAYLFVPDISDLKDYFKNFTDSMSKSLGFLWTPFDFTINILRSIISTEVTNNTCDIGYNLKLCAWRYNFPQVWEIFQKLLQSAVVIVLIYAYWRKIANIFDIDKSEEVAE